MKQLLMIAALIVLVAINVDAKHRPYRKGTTCSTYNCYSKFIKRPVWSKNRAWKKFKF